MSSQAGSIRHSLVTSIDRSCSYRKVSGQNMFAAQPGRLSLPIKSPCTEWPVSNKFPHLYTPQRWWTDCSWASRRQTRMYTLASAGTDTEHPLPSWETAPRSMTCCASAFPPSFLSLWRKAEWTDVITWQLIDFPNQINCRVKPGNQETAWYLIFKLEALHVVHVSVAVMKVTLQGCSWHFLCCPRLHCRILIKPIAVVPSGGSTERSGNDWLWLVMTGCDWIWLAMTGCDWIWLVVTGYDWLWLDVTGYDWMWLVVIGYDWLWLVHQSPVLTMMSHEVPTGQDRPSRSQPCSSGFYTPCDYSRHLSLWSHDTWDIPAWNKNQFEERVVMDLKVLYSVQCHWQSYLGVGSNPVWGFAVIIAFLDPLLQPIAFDRIVPQFTTTKTMDLESRS